ncbi:hypothetical protein ACVWXM_006762 [Bradyrhizobium sp. GM7.3]
MIEDVQHALGAVDSDEQMLAVFRRELMLATAAVPCGTVIVTDHFTEDIPFWRHAAHGFAIAMVSVPVPLFPPPP